MDPSRTRLALEHMRDAILDLHALLDGRTRDAFVADRLCQRAVERCLEVLSEASRRLPEPLKARFPQIPWPKVAGIGNVLRHDYDEIDVGVIWRTATVEIAPLAAVVDTLLAEVKDE